MPNHNDFTEEKAKEKSPYALWILAKPDLAAKLPRNPWKYYSYPNKPNGGLDALLSLAEKRSRDCYLMVLYDNTVPGRSPKDSEIRRWENEPIPEHMRNGRGISTRTPLPK